MAQGLSGWLKGPGQHIRRHAQAFAWTGFDQLLSSISNVIVSLALARSGGADALGIFTIAFAVYLIALGFLRALLSEPFLTLPLVSTQSPDKQERFGVTTALAYLLPASLVVVGSGLVVGGREIVVVGLILPFVCLQDFYRYLFFRRGRPEFAAAIDAAWVLASIAGWPLIASTGSADVALLTWAFGGALGAGLGLALSRIAPARLAESVRWWWRNLRPLGGFLAVDGLLYTLFTELSTLGLAAILGTSDLGTWRGAQIVLGPVALVLTAFGLYALPRIAASRDAQTPHVAMIASFGASSLAALSTLALWLAAPVLIPLLYDNELEVPRVLIVAVGARIVVGALATGPNLVLKAQQRGRPIVVGRVVSGVVGVPIMLGVAATLGLVASVWSGVVGTAIYVMVLAMALRTTPDAADSRNP